MTFYEEMADLAVEMLGPDSEFGEQLTLVRAGGAYDPVTRKRGAGAPISLPFWGTTDSELTPVSLAGSLTATHERVMTGVPPAGATIRPGQDDRITAEGSSWIVVETAHVIKRNVDILWVAGLKSA